MKNNLLCKKTKGINITANIIVPKRLCVIVRWPNLRSKNKAVGENILPMKDAVVSMSGNNAPKAAKESAMGERTTFTIAPNKLTDNVAKAMWVGAIILASL
jgi:hypothetical protein